MRAHKLLFKKLTYLCLVAFTYPFAPAYAGDHDGCYSYIRVINNSNYRYYISGGGTKGNRNWHSGGLNNLTYIGPGEETNVYTYPETNRSQLVLPIKNGNFYYQYFVLSREDKSPDYYYEFKLFLISNFLSLTNLKTNYTVRTNSSDIVGERFADSEDFPKEYSLCNGFSKPEITITIDSYGHVDDNQLIAGTY